MSRYLPVLGLILILLSSCGGGGSNDNMSQSDEKTAEAALYGEVIAIHDQVMPRMTDINDLRGRLDGKIAALEEEENISNDDQALLTLLKATLANLQESDDKMMDWMRNFKPITDEMEHQAVMDRLNEEKGKIEKVKVEIEEALTKAESVVAEAGI